MALQDIVTVTVTLEGAGVSRAGFGTPLFISSYRASSDLIRSYNDINAVGVDYPTTSDAYIAANAFFSQEPSPAQIKIGRRESNAELTPNPAGTGGAQPMGTEYSFFITVNPGGTNASEVLYTTLAANEDAATVAAGLKGVLDALADIAAHVTATVVGTGDNAVLQITPTVAVTDFFFIDESQNDKLDLEYVGRITADGQAATTLNAIEAVDEDFYFITADDHTNTGTGTEPWVTQMAAAVDSRDKLYFVSSAAAESLLTFTGTTDPLDVIGLVTDGNHLRTITFWSQVADTQFPECAFVGFNAPFDAGSVTWNALQLVGVPAGTDPDSGLKLTSTQKGFLSDRNANFVDIIGGVSATREGKSAGGEWIDNLRGRDALKIRMTEDLQNLILNQGGGKIPYTNSGINQVRSAMNTRLQTFVDSGFLASFTTTLPDAADVPDADKQNRILNNATFEGILASAIHIIVITGSLAVS